MCIARLVSHDLGLDYESDDYLGGYVRGLVEGDGSVQRQPTRPYVRVAMTDPEALDRLEWALHAFGVPGRRSTFNPGTAGYLGRKPIERVLFGGASGAPMTARLLAWPVDSEASAAGYLAGVFDAEGSCERIGTPRIAQRADSALLGLVVAAGRRLGIEFRIESWRRGARGQMAGARLYGDPATPAVLRFFSLTRPAIMRKMAVWGRPIRNSWVRVLDVAPGPTEALVSIQTSGRTFVAAGFASHNCPFVAHCWPEARLELSERPRYIVQAVSALKDVEVPA